MTMAVTSTVTRVQTAFQVMFLLMITYRDCTFMWCMHLLAVYLCIYIHVYGIHTGKANIPLSFYQFSILFF